MANKMTVLLLAVAAFAAASLPGASAIYCTDDDFADDDFCGCAYAPVVIDDGQRCGGDRNGCCQSTNIGIRQNAYPNCNNPNDSVKPAYCSSSIKPNGLWTPWACDKMKCKDTSVCACNNGDCTCQSKTNFANIKNNGKGYSKAACGATSFAGDYACAIQ